MDSNYLDIQLFQYLDEIHLHSISAWSPESTDINQFLSEDALSGLHLRHPHLLLKLGNTFFENDPKHMVTLGANLSEAKMNTSVFTSFNWKEFWAIMQCTYPICTIKEKIYTVIRGLLHACGMICWWHLWQGACGGQRGWALKLTLEELHGGTDWLQCHVHQVAPRSPFCE